jgi:hypothetical protein
MSQSSPAALQIIRKLLPYTTVAAVLALIYVGWVFYYRSNQNSELQRAADQKAVEQARKTNDLYGSGHLKILLFYAAPPVVTPGGSSELCYGVANATTMKIEPAVEGFKPSLNRCVPVKPAHSTTYTITAADDMGHSTSQSVNVVVR